MPSVQKGQSEADYIKICVPTMIREGKKQDQAVAACMNMYKNKWQEHKKSTASSDNSDSLNTLKKDKSPHPMSPIQNPTRSQANNLNKNMKTNEEIRNSLPNPIKANRPVAPEESGAKYDINTIPDNPNKGIEATFKDGQYTFNLDIRESNVSKVDWSKRPLQLTQDGKSNRVSNLVHAEAKHIRTSKTVCDNCGKTLTSYSSESPLHPAYLDSEPNRGEIQLSLRDPKNNSYDLNHYCDEACLASHLEKRKQEKVQNLKNELGKHQEFQAKKDSIQVSEKKI